jgi:Flp pilus assembly protein TadD
VRDAATLLTLFTADANALSTYARNAEVQRDDRMTLEFSVPRQIYGATTDDNAGTLRRLTDRERLPVPVRDAWLATTTHTHRGLMYLRASPDQAFDEFAQALGRNPTDAAAIDGLLRAAPAARRVADAEAILKQLLARDPRNVDLATSTSRLIAARGDLAAAAELLRPLFTGPTPDIDAIDQLASLFADGGDTSALGQVVADLQRIAPESEPALYYAATLHFMTNRLPDAIAAGERLRQRNGRHARCLNLLGAAYANVGRAADARNAFEASIVADPRDPAAYVNLATFELQAGQPAAAENYFAQALTIDPSSTAARDGLARVMAALRRQ